MNMTNKDEQEVYIRLSKSARIQHVIMFSSFLILVLTGFPLLFPNVKILKYIFIFPGAFVLRGVIHRIAAAMLIGVCIYHFFHIILNEKANKNFREMIPKPKDILDAINSVLHNLGIKPEHPKYGKFNFIEKFEYIALAWGSIIMILTGFILWFEELAMIFLPKWVIDIVMLVHGFEALLAFLAIIIWHMYNVHLNPEVFPMSRIWINGKVTKEYMMRHHPLEYEEIIKKEESND